MHESIRNGRVITLFPIHPSPYDGEVNVLYNDYTASVNRKNPTILKLPKSDEYPLTRKTQELTMGHYHRPKSSNFPAVDSLFLVQPAGRTIPILLMLQMTRARGVHETKLGGLQMIDDMELPSKALKYYVVVTPEGIHPTITVPREYFENEDGEIMSFSRKLRVLHCPVSFDELFPQNRP